MESNEEFGLRSVSEPNAAYSINNHKSAPVKIEETKGNESELVSEKEDEVSEDEVEA